MATLLGGRGFPAMANSAAVTVMRSAGIEVLFTALSEPVHPVRLPKMRSLSKSWPLSRRSY